MKVEIVFLRDVSIFRKHYVAKVAENLREFVFSKLQNIAHKIGLGQNLVLS